MNQQQPSLWRIVVAAGPDAGEVRELPDSSTLECGRRTGLGLTLSDSRVSSRHVKLTVTDARLVLEDLGSTNGTVVRGTRVGHCELAHGDLIVLGVTKLRVESLMAPPVAPPPVPAATAPSGPPAPGEPPVLSPATPVAQPANVLSQSARPSKSKTHRVLLWAAVGIVGLMISLLGVLLIADLILLGGSGRWDLMGSVVRSTFSNGFSGRLRPQALPLHDTQAVDVRPDPAVRITAPTGALDIDRDFQVRRIDPETLPAEQEVDSFTSGVPFAAFDIDAGMEDDDLFVHPVRFAFDLDELEVPDELRDHLALIRYDSMGRREALEIRRDGRWLSCDVRHNAAIHLLVVFGSLVNVLVGKDHSTKWGGVGAMLGDDYALLGTPQFQIWFPFKKMPLRETPDYLKVKGILEEKKRYYLHDMQVFQEPGKPPLTHLDRLAMFAADEDVVWATARLKDRDFLVENVLPYPVVHALGALDRASEYLYRHRGFRKPGNKVDVILPITFTGGTAYGFSDDGHFTFPYIHLNTNAIPKVAPGTADPRALDELDTSVLHELFHVVQKEYFNWSKYLSPGQIWSGTRYMWFVEATALVLEEDAEPYYRSKGWTRQHFGKTFVPHLHMGWYKVPLDASMGNESDAQDKGYSASRFLLSLRDRYYASNRDAFLKRYLETFGTFSSPVGALSEVTSRSGLVLGGDFQLFCAKHVDEIVNATTPPAKDFTLSPARPVARWPLEAAPLSSAIGIFDYSSLGPEQLGKALLVVRTDVADGVAVTTRFSQTKSEGWRTVDVRKPFVMTEAPGGEKGVHKLGVQRIDASPGEWYWRPIASWFEDARTTVTLVEKPAVPPKVELLDDEDAVRLEFPASPLESSGELLRREARIAFGNSKEVVIAFTEGREGDVAWRQIARGGNARAIQGMSPAFGRMLLPQDLDDMIAVWKAFRGVMGGEELKLNIRYRLVVKRREIDTAESTGVDGPWSEVFEVPLEAPELGGHPGDVSGTWKGQVMIYHKPIQLDLSMDGQDIRGAMLFGGTAMRIEGRWMPEQYGWECSLFSNDPKNPGGSFVQPYLRALPDGGLWLAAPPAVLRKPKVEEPPDTEKVGWWQGWFGD